jgi:hypothetical protein
VLRPDQRSASWCRPAASGVFSFGKPRVWKVSAFTRTLPRRPWSMLALSVELVPAFARTRISRSSRGSVNQKS